MHFFDIFSIVLALVAFFAFINIKFLKLPTTIGVMVSALGFSAILICLHHLGFESSQVAKSILSNLNFQETFMNGMLSFLLFAGALHVNFNDLREQKFPILVLSSFGVLISTFVVGLLSFYVLSFFQPQMELIYCLLFGALIAPTDPIAVLSLLRQTEAPKALEIKITGESLFNDGVAVVLFEMLLEIATGTESLNASSVGILFIRDAFGGILFGLSLGYVAYKLLQAIDDYKVAIIITLALAAGGYRLAHFLQVSGPIAMVMAGLLIGNQGRAFAISDLTKRQLYPFWELVDEILSLVLFTLIGLEVVAISYNTHIFFAGLSLVPVVLVGRFFSVWILISFLKLFIPFSKGAIPILTWGGLRGGISVALALSLPDFYGREVLIGITYASVVFSVIVQGLTFKKVLVYFLK